MEPAITSFMDVVEASKGHDGTTQCAEDILKTNFPDNVLPADARTKSSTSAFWPILVKIHEMDEIAHLSPTHDDGTAFNSGLEFLDFRVCATENMVHFTTQTSFGEVQL
ncbi:conserved hypothetical protein [Culex quinquefasciatus]|uniref:Uncharacterized protein n=1 Tax=Culex quinquefasciatus TaxID=7176 RepID=B0XBY1_CULQU|nr:conserved hypothetical protein [Culex quinquefasciatus]|eukprot:XP_001867153.1 conserved hypothetical protein [Culex quinquefasciatus]